MSSVDSQGAPPDRQQREAELARRVRVDAFVRHHFTWPGTLHLHRAALGMDILRAPVNVLLSPILVLAKITAWICRKLRLARASDWILERRLLLRTAVSSRVEAAILNDLLDVPMPLLTAIPDRAAMSRAVLAAPGFREMMRKRSTVADAQATADRIIGALGDYTGTRSAIAELTTALITLAIGGIAFRALTPGMISMAPGVAGAVAHSTVVADFPLGASLGEVWYGVFPIGPSPGLIAATIVGLMILGSVIAAFAGVISDPVQVRLGIHRRRLLRLFETLDAEMGGSRDKPFAANEHVMVRIFDVWDAALSLLRVFRG